MEIKLKTSLDAECGVGDLVILSVYPRLFGVFGSSFCKLPECPKYCKASISQPSYGFYACSNKAWFLFKYFGQSILLLWSNFSDG